MYDSPVVGSNLQNKVQELEETPTLTLLNCRRRTNIRCGYILPVAQNTELHQITVSGECESYTIIQTLKVDNDPKIFQLVDLFTV